MNPHATNLPVLQSALRAVAAKGVTYLAPTGKNSCREPAILIDAEHQPTQKSSSTAALWPTARHTRRCMTAGRPVQVEASG